MDKLDKSAIRRMAEKAEKAREIDELIQDLGTSIDIAEFGSGVKTTLGRNRMHPAPKDGDIGIAALSGIIEALRTKRLEIEGDIGHTVELGAVPDNPLNGLSGENP